VKYGPAAFELRTIGRFNDHDSLLLAEQLFIAELGTKAPEGYNLSDGGAGMFNPSAEVREKMSAAKRGKPSPHRGRKFGPISEEHRCSIRRANLGKKHSEETRQRMSESKRGDKNPQFGKPKTEEWKTRMSEVNTGNTYAAGHRHTDEWKEAARLRMLGNKFNRHCKKVVVNG
jgi:group I intron endonuclease